MGTVAVISSAWVGVNIASPLQYFLITLLIFYLETS